MLSSLVTGPRQTVVIGRIVCAHVGDAYVQDEERCYIDTEGLRLIGRMHGSGWYARCTDLFQMDRPNWAEWHRKRRAERARPGRGAMKSVATTPHQGIGTIILDFLAGPELWCSSLGHRPKVQVRTFGSCLLQANAFAHKTRHFIKA